MKIKCLVLLFSILFVSFYVHAGSNDGYYKKIAEKFDVPEEAKVTNRIPSDFWINVMSYNDKLFDFAKKMQKMKGAEKEAYEMAEEATYHSDNDPYLCKELQGFCDTLLINLGIDNALKNTKFKCTLHVVIDEDVNAYTILVPGGFSMYLTTGLIEKDGCTYDILMGVIAHELAHGLFFHHLQTYYAEAKKKRENELVGAIAAGLSSYSEAYSNARGTRPMSKLNTRRLAEHLKSETRKYTLKFSRDKEYEADIVAFRFMQWIGKDNAFIEVLNFLGTDYDHLYNDDSDHPTTSSRICLIQYLLDHPEIQNKDIAKLRKKNKKKGQKN